MAAAAVRSAGDWALGDWEAWSALTKTVGDELPKALLCVAMAAVGLQISPAAIGRAGWRPFAVGAAGALLIAGTGLMAALLVGAVLPPAL